jgi:hypothetical protein
LAKTVPPASASFPLYVLREYAFGADGERGFLIGPRGEIAWMCFPRWDSPAIFSTLIGGAGVYAVTPIDEPFVWGGEYEAGSLIWRSHWVTTHQKIECREALAFPGDDNTAVLIRRIEAIDGNTKVQVVLDPRADFGATGMSELSHEDGRWTARCGKLHLRWTGASSAKVADDGSLRFLLEVTAGTHHDLMLEISTLPLGATPDIDEVWGSTVAAWSDAVPVLAGTIADRDARHAVAVLTGMTSSGGGMVAGATTSLPEHFEQGRNYDYRYAWIRDQCYAGQAAAVTGQLPLLAAAVQFVSDRLLADKSQLKPAYTVDGQPVPNERRLKLPGYPGGNDKVGNWVNKQFQLDAFGEALLLFAAAADVGALGREIWSAVEIAATAIGDTYQRPDAGIWELTDAKWTHSRLSCIAGLRKIAHYAPTSQAAQWSALADAMLAEISSSSLHPSGRWQRTPDDPRIDSALLIPAVRGALPTDDPRTIATLDSALAELGQEGYMYRFRDDDRPLGESEGAFLLCGFMTSLALHQQGRQIEAARWFERNRAACGTPGIFAEEFSTIQRQMRGNMPQAFVHALLLESAKRLAENPTP